MLYAVIPAGGSGTRLWPLSRAAHPKFLHALTGSSSTLLQATVERLAPLVEPATTYVVTGVAHAAAVARQLPEVPDGNVVVEPSQRDSCPAIALAAAIIARRDPDAVMGSFAADHLVRSPERFRETVQAAMVGAQAGYLMTVGITPTHAETGYGYVHVGDPIGDAGVRAVTEFKEKPTSEVAERYVSSGEYLWNASIFVWRVDVFLAEVARQQPALHDGVRAIAAAWDSESREAVIEREWPRLPRIAVDYAVMEGAAAAGRVATVPGDFGWHDIGDFHTLGEVLQSDDRGNVVLDVALGSGLEKGDVVMIDTTDTVVVQGGGRIVTAVGVRDLIIVDTPDALLISSRDRAQDVKQMVDELRQRGHQRHI
ncbi:MAG TPA: sugar phosphate nucleotidyltransferase [Micromonosporaceae bacterium]|nr:sugar phosphate nucleotidyltransferase [Micromonosporaceae bacterium]